MIRSFRDSAAAGAVRVVFEPRPPVGGHTPATVVLRAGGAILVRYKPAHPPVPGVGREDFVHKAAEIAAAVAGA